MSNMIYQPCSPQSLYTVTRAPFSEAYSTLTPAKHTAVFATCPYSKRLLPYSASICRPRAMDSSTDGVLQLLPPLPSGLYVRHTRCARRKRPVFDEAKPRERSHRGFSCLQKSMFTAGRVQASLGSLSVCLACTMHVHRVFALVIATTVARGRFPQTWGLQKKLAGLVG